jgi:carboxyl-terminal processing protease
MSIMTDLSNLTLSESFNALCAQLAREYPFTAWKGIDWDALAARYASRIARAEQEQSARDYYRALREFVYAIPDARMQLWGNDGGSRHAHIGGGFGLALTRLDDGRVLICDVLKNSPAARANIRIGAQILAWNDLPIHAALTRTPIVWAERPPATRALREIQQCRLLTRAPIGASARVTCCNPRDHAQTVELIAEDDAMELFRRTALVATQPTSGAVVGKILPSGIGLITLHALAPDSSRIYFRFRNILRDFIQQRVVGVVIDLRRCDDGDDALAATLAGFFRRTPIFYAALARLDEATQTFSLDWRDSEMPLRIMPQRICYEGPVAAIIGARTSGAAEGLARGIQRAQHGTLVGFGASSGMFSGAMRLRAGEAQMPGGYIVAFPTTRGLNQDGVIQIEGNRFGEGGLAPDVRVPFDEETFAQVFIEGRDVALTYAVFTLTNAARQIAAREQAARRQVVRVRERCLPVFGSRGLTIQV